eukprot:scaffold612172_cov39-Prasinocladus_malaysianus.AAC.1
MALSTRTSTLYRSSYGERERDRGRRTKRIRVRIQCRTVECPARRIPYSSYYSYVRTSRPDYEYYSRATILRVLVLSLSSRTSTGTSIAVELCYP